jgi:hypothetical protein
MEQGGSDEIDNAIAVCFECHAEIHSYNDAHPRGRKFRPEELRRHKEQWLKLCADRPEMLIHASWDADVGPLQALIDELEFNLAIATSNSRCTLLTNELHRAIREGAIATLNPTLKDAITAAYAAIGQANHQLDTSIRSSNPPTGGFGPLIDGSLREAKPKIETARDELLRFLGSDN